MSLTLKLLAVLPRKALSHFVGYLVHLESPQWFSHWLKSRLIKSLKINPSEAEFDLDHYVSFGAFFSRRLKPGARPISSSQFVSPCDGQLQSFEEITSGKLLQAKGIEYSLNDFLGSSEGMEKYLGGTAITIYLAPDNYHRVHYPIDMSVLKSQKVAGDLWPVNKQSVNAIHPLFCLNERWIVEGEVKDKGQLAIVMVGATNVGKMELFHLDVNQFSEGDVIHLHENEIARKKGEELGVFHMGSTVILLLDRNLSDHCKMNLHEGPVVCSESIGD